MFQERCEISEYQTMRKAQCGWPVGLSEIFREFANSFSYTRLVRSLFQYKHSFVYTICTREETA
jgi:hypothetical protein